MGTGKKEGKYSRQREQHEKLPEAGRGAWRAYGAERGQCDHSSVAQEETGIRRGEKVGGHHINSIHPSCGDGVTITAMKRLKKEHALHWHLVWPSLFKWPPRQCLWPVLRAGSPGVSYQWPCPTAFLSENSVPITGVRILLITKPSQRTQNRSSKFFSGFSTGLFGKPSWVTGPTVAI